MTGEWQLDHLVIRSGDVEQTLRFYKDALGLPAERELEWRRGEVSFPSIRINTNTVLDIFPVELESTDSIPGPKGQQVGHFCLALPRARWEYLEDFLPAEGHPLLEGPVERWGARGKAQSVYIQTPDGLPLELRTYDP